MYQLLGHRGLITVSDNGISLFPCKCSGYLAFPLHVPHAHRKSIVREFDKFINADHLQHKVPQDCLWDNMAARGLSTEVNGFKRSGC